MKSAKKLMAVVLTLILALSVFAISASALDGNMAFTLETSSATYSVGDAVVVNVYVSSDYNATCMRIPVLYSADVFEVPTSGNIRLTAYGDCSTYKGSLEANTSNDGSYTPDAYSSGDYSAVLLQWTASVNSSRIGAFKSTDSVKCFSFQLNVKTTAGGQTGSIFIPSADETDLFYDQAVVDVTDATTICRVNTSITTNSLNIEIEQGEADGITTYDGSQVIIDHTAKIIKNWSTGLTLDIIKANVKATGNAALLYTASTLSGAQWGTGAVVTVTSGGSELANYSILMYGDVNGDGTINGLDASGVLQTVAGYKSLDSDLEQTAADVNSDGAISGLDATRILGAVAGSSVIDQTA
jgi:hypothetical protein